MGFVKTLSRHGNAGGGKGRFRAFAGFMVSKSQRQVSREHTGRGARQLSPSELSIAVRAASQGPRKNDLRMWREYAEATLFHVAALQPNHMAFIANGFARADVPDREVFDRMSDHALRQVPHFEPRDMALFLNAYARLQFRDLALFNSFSKSIRRASSVGYGEQQLSLLCNAYARLELADTELFKKLSRWTARRIVEFTPQGVATVANAYAKVLLCDETLLGALREGISRNGAEFKAQHVANLLNAFARLELKEERVALDKLATQIPNHSRDFQPLELSQALHALVKLNLAIDHRKSMICLAEAVQDKADEFHSRQLALTLHSFSLLNTSYGRMLQNMAPQVLSTLNMADHQSAAMVFCAYARAGQVHSEVLQALAEKLYLGVAEAGEQMQVQLFYACGRFGLYKEPLSIALAELLQQNVRTLSGQHLANCLLTLSRLSLCNEQFASLQAALQARLLRRDVHFEPQHLANSLHALAGIYGDGAPPQAALSSPLPGSVVPRLVDEVVQGSTWQQNPQLLASVAIASARLRQGSPELFSLVSQTVRRDVARGTPKLSKQNQSELLWSFAVSGFFDLQLFSWVMSQLDAGSLSSVPMDVLLSTLQCLDYVSFSGQLNEQDPICGFVSHYWGENLEKFLDGLKQHLTVRNLSGRTGYWIGAFASRHQDFATAELGEMSTTPLAKVAEAAHFRMLLITDASPEVAMPAALFTRTWCTFELALCLDCTALCVDVCAVRNKDAEVLTCGLTSQEICSSKYCPGVGIHLKQQRERNFPLEVAKAALDFSIEKTHASREEERQRLLGCMALPLEGEEQVETYQRMTRRLRSFLLLAFWPHVLCRADLQDKAYMSMLLDMAKGIQGDYWRTSLSLMLAGCDLAKKELLDLAMQSLMSNLEWLKLDLQFTNLEDASLSSLAKALPPKLKTLGVDLAGCSISDRGVFSFLSKLPNTVTKVTMKLQHTKVTPGLLELSKDGPCALLKWSNLSHSERVQALKEKMEIIEGRKNPLAAPNPSQVNRKVALENLAILPPNAIADQVLQQVKADLANLMGEGHP